MSIQIPITIHFWNTIFLSLISQNLNKPQLITYQFFNNNFLSNNEQRLKTFRRSLKKLTLTIYVKVKVKVIGGESSKQHVYRNYISCLWKIQILWDHIV